MNIRDRKVTIGICLYNGEPFIAAALKSALAQTHENIEMLVYNDGSRDGGPAIVRSFSDPRLQLIDAPQNCGLGFGRNHLGARAQGDYVTWLDNDDIFDRDRVERLLKTAVASDADITIDSYRMIDEAGAPLPGTLRVPDRIAAERHFTRLF
jgi:glycosyltransferase involved in cell wall biosynthesis